MPLIRRFALITAIASSLSACGAMQRYEYVSDFNQFIAKSKPQAESGALKWSDYYMGIYEKGLRAGLAPKSLLAANELISISKAYEASQISKDEFEHRQREQLAMIQQGAYEQNAQNDAARAQIVSNLATVSGMYGGQQPQAQTSMPMRPMLIQNTPSGSYRYCKYSDGSILTYGIVSSCPLSK